MPLAYTRLAMGLATWLIFLFLTSFSITVRPQTGPTLSTEAQIEEEFAAMPCKNNTRIDGVRTLFQKMGASPQDIAIEKFGENQNVVVTIKGQEPGRIVMGAHYDFVDAGCGAIDNWTGIVAIAHTYRTVRQLVPHKTVSFVAFGNEEKGLFGSWAMVRAIPKTDLAQYCAMINIDSFGMGTPFALKNASSPKLSALVQERATALNIPYSVVSLNGDSDSHSFLDRNIPAVTLSGLAEGWEKILHSPKDQTTVVNGMSVYLGYQLALSTWDAIDNAACDAFRESAKKP